MVDSPSSTKFMVKDFDGRIGLAYIPHNSKYLRIYFASPDEENLQNFSNTFYRLVSLEKWEELKEFYEIIGYMSEPSLDSEAKDMDQAAESQSKGQSEREVGKDR